MSRGSPHDGLGDAMLANISSCCSSRVSAWKVHNVRTQVRGEGEAAVQHAQPFAITVPLVDYM